MAVGHELHYGSSPQWNTARQGGFNDMTMGGTGETPVKVVLVDDHALFRRGLRRLLEGHGFDVVGEGSHGRAAVQLAAELKPDVIVCDLSMPLMGGVEAITHIVHADPDARILVLTISGESDEVIDALLAGASGYLLKDARGEEIVRAVQAAAAGECAIAPRVAGRIVSRLREVGRPQLPVLPENLTDREVDVLRLLATGKENAAIAQELFLSPKTVKNHVSSILDKLDIDNRIQAAVLAVRQGIV
jgi:DNA-binding NarL/FixJ family response regulator